MNVLRLFMMELRTLQDFGRCIEPDVWGGLIQLEKTSLSALERVYGFCSA